MNDIRIDVNRLETHDRLLDFKKKNVDDVAEQINSLILQNPFDDHPFYIYAHKRTVTIEEKLHYWQSGRFATLEQIPAFRIIWQPRLQRPKAEPNSMLFKVHPAHPEEVRIIWMLPPMEQWDAHTQGNMFENQTVVECIQAYKTDRASLERPDPEDPSDDRAKAIYKKLYPKIWHRLFPNVQ